MKTPLIWVLADNRPGNVAQAVGVAEAMGHPFSGKEIRYTPLARLPNCFHGDSLRGVTPETRALLAPPWPDVVISAGRRTAPVARWIKRRNPDVFLAHLMHPGRIGAGDFDLIAVPEHDRAKRGSDVSNVLRTIGAPHRLSQQRVAEAKGKWQARLAALPRPLVTLLVGGATRRKPFPGPAASDLAQRVRKMARHGSVLLATSRRTGADAEKALLAGIPEPRFTYLWGEAGENPYAGLIALADAIVVTGDSVSMCSEACATQRPVYIFAPEGMVTAKHARLHQQLFDRGLARPFVGELEDWIHPPLNAAHDVARAIEQRMRAR